MDLRAEAYAFVVAAAAVEEPRDTVRSRFTDRK